MGVVVREHGHAVDGEIGRDTSASAAKNPDAQQNILKKQFCKGLEEVSNTWKDIDEHESEMRSKGHLILRKWNLTEA